MINNTDQDETPYFLTADHCGISTGNDQSMVVIWNYENSYCRVPGSNDSGGNGNGSTNQYTTGALYLTGSSQTDFTLVRLNSSPPDSYEISFSGWSRSAGTPTIGSGNPSPRHRREADLVPRHGLCIRWRRAVSLGRELGSWTHCSRLLGFTALQREPSDRGCTVLRCFLLHQRLGRLLRPITQWILEPALAVSRSEWIGCHHAQHLQPLRPGQQWRRVLLSGAVLRHSRGGMQQRRRHLECRRQLRAGSVASSPIPPVRAATTATA